MSRLLWISVLAGSWLRAAGVEFNRDVRPILSDKCFQCHGPDARNKGVPVRLDVEEEAKARAIVPGMPDQSELIRRITTASKAKRMPPAHTGHSVAAAEVDVLREWIAAGAPWQKHWAFLTPRQAPVPPGVHPVDHFVRARLETAGLRPSPPADPDALLRRVSFDLTGLPPTPAELAAFRADPSVKAYERAVDRLLASPRFGERLAARWLDAARYADSNGYQYDGERVMWRWRDYVIDSFNANKPFNQFVMEQLAGDLLPGATLEQKIATGFNRNHRINTEDGIIPEEYAVEYVVDRVETAGAVFLGLTTGCARCHNHKYDPISQREFYQFFAYFNNVPEIGRGIKYGNSHPYVAAPTGPQQQEWEALTRRIQALERKLAQIPGKRDPKGYRPAVALDYEQEFPAIEPRVAGSAGMWDIDDRFTLSARIESVTVPDGPILTRMVDAPQGKGYGLAADHGKIHFHLTSVYADDALRVETAPVLQAGRSYQVTVTYDGSKMASGIRMFLDGQPVPHRTLNETLYRPFNNARSIFPQPLRIGMGWGVERRFSGRIEESRAWGRILSDAQIRAMAGIGDPAQLARLAFEDATPLGRERNELLLAREQLEARFPTVMVMAERPERRDTFLLDRGAYDKPLEKVEPGVFAALPPLRPDQPNNRLGLAQWLTAPDHPLLARVTVNRFWQMLFGVGLVKTTEDFGLQGEWPSHPELLDWLAVDFVQSGWNTKALLKRIVMSETYRQSSKTSPELVQRDPENRLLSRGPRVRLAPEMVRDQALFAAGLLVEKLGGPSVKPYQPDGLWTEITMQSGEYQRDQGESLYRRSLYTYWRRTVAPPMMMNFDASQRESCQVREHRTNTPLQALNLMNDVTFLEAARVLGGILRRDGLAAGFERVLSRRPSASEQQVLESSLAYHRDYFSDETRARKFIAQGDSPVDPRIPAREQAAHMAVASLLFNLDEAVSKP